MARIREEPLLRGKYRILERIGAGGMAAVYAALHVGTDRPVAVKRILPDRRGDSRALARFEREAKAAGRVRSPHVVEVLDVDHDDDGAPFIVLERLFGESLFDRMRREPRLPPATAIGIARQMLAGCADMHRAGVIHRDLKPANVFLVEIEGGPPLVKLLDFGVSKVDGGGGAEITQVDETLGTFAFMPPEQIGKSVSVGPAADLWSVGVVLFRMLTGCSPFAASDPTSLVALIVHHRPLTLTGVGLDQGVAAALDPVIARALEKDPAKRHGSADDMREELERAATSLGLDLGPAVARAATSMPPPGAAAVRGGDEAPTRHGVTVSRRAELNVEAASRRRASAAIALGLAAAAGGVAGWAAMSAARSGGAHVAIVTTPPGAAVSIDGVPIADPSRVAVASGRRTRARISAPGFEGVELDLPARGGSALVVKLAAAPAEQAPAEVAPPPPPAEPAPAADPPVPAAAPATPAEDPPPRAAPRERAGGRPQPARAQPPPADDSRSKRPRAIPVAPY